MSILLTTTRLVISRFRHDPWRHAAGALAIALLLAAFVMLGGLAIGLEEGLSASLEEERPHHFRLERTLRGDAAPAFDADDMEHLRALRGVDRLHPYRYHETNLTFRERGPGPSIWGGGGFSVEAAEASEQAGDPASAPKSLPSLRWPTTAFLVGLHAVAEQDLLVRNPRPAPSPPDSGGGLDWGGSLFLDSSHYYLEEGRWIEAPGETVVPRSVADHGAPLGSTIEFEHDNVSYAFKVVGVIDDASPAGFLPPGYIRSSQGHDYFVIDEQDFPFKTYGPVRLVTEPDYHSMQSVLDELERTYPDTWRTLRYQVLEFERHHFDTVQAVAALAAASQLSGVVGVGTVFGIMLLLLGRETRSLGILSSIGYPRRTLLYYAFGKLALLTIVAVPFGIGLGLLFEGRMPTPDVAFAVEPAMDVGLLVSQGLRAVGLGLLGAAVAIIMVLRYAPAEAVKTEE